jgi:hypothetical protein
LRHQYLGLILALQFWVVSVTMSVSPVGFRGWAVVNRVAAALSIFPTRCANLRGHSADAERGHRRGVRYFFRPAAAEMGPLDFRFWFHL